jgi:hypothetical protein
MINSIEFQEARGKRERKALRILGEEYEVASAGLPKPKFEGYYNIFLIIEIENPFTTSYQDPPKGNLSIQDSYMIL